MGQTSNAIQGAAGGALTGAAVGSVIPGVGTAIGGVAGGLLGGLGGLFGNQGGIPGSEEEMRRLQALADMYGGRTAPQMENSAFRGNQQALVRMLEEQASGGGPSQAAAMLAAATERNSRAAASRAAGTTGPNAALAQFQAQNTIGNLGAQSAQDAAAARIAEMNAARNQLGLVLQGARGQDESVGQNNLEAKLRQMGINDQAQLQAIMQKIGLLTGNASVPSMGEQLLAGGAGAFGQAISGGLFGKRGTGSASRPVDPRDSIGSYGTTGMY